MIDCTPQIIEELAAETGIPKHKVEKAVRSQYAHAAATMASDTFRSVRISYIGAFKVMDKVLLQAQKDQLSGKIPPERVKGRPDSYPHIEELDNEPNQ